MPRYRRKPQEVEAWQVGTEPVPEWVLSEAGCYFGKHGFNVPISNGSKSCWVVEDGFWVVMKEGSDVDAMPDEIFHMYYEVIE